MQENYYNKFINFFKKYNLYNKDLFNYIWNNSNFFNYLEEDYRPYIGIYYKFDKKGRLMSFNLIVPFIDSNETLLINIHEYLHAIFGYYYIGKRIRIDESCEVLSLLFEKLYLSNNKDEKLQNFKIALDNMALKSNEEKYILGLKVADELFDKIGEHPNLKKLYRKSKLLIKKYKYFN